MGERGGASGGIGRTLNVQMAMPGCPDCHLFLLPYHHRPLSFRPPPAVSFSF